MKTLRVYTSVLTVVLMAFAFALPVFADYAGNVTKEDVKGTFRKPGYSPYAGNRVTASENAP